MAMEESIVVDLYSFAADGLETKIPYLNQMSPVLEYNATKWMLKTLVEHPNVQVYDHVSGNLITEATLPKYFPDLGIGFGMSIVSQLMPGGNGCPLYLVKDHDKHYLIDYDAIDYANAYDYFWKHFHDDTDDSQPFAIGGGCSAVRSGSFFGRNYDWYYDHHVVFTVHTSACQGRHSVFGNAATVPDMVEDFVESRRYSSSYKLLPFFLLDGRNDAGLLCEMNILIPGQTINGHVADTRQGTTPTVELRDTVCTLMLVRYILDNFSSVQDVVENLPKYTSVYAAHSASINGEFHLMLCDAEDTYVLEFIPNADTGAMEMVFIESSSDPILTNFYKYGSERKEDGHIDETTLTRYAEGIERYNIAADALVDEPVNSLNDMHHIMYDLLKYTHTYTIDDLETAWLSEFVGVVTIEGVTYDITTDDVVNHKENVRPVYEYCQRLYENRSRDIPNTWQTVHSAAYNIEDGSMCLTVDENGITKTYKYKFPWGV